MPETVLYRNLDTPVVKETNHNTAKTEDNRQENRSRDSTNDVLINMQDETETNQHLKSDTKQENCCCTILKILLKAFIKGIARSVGNKIMDWTISLF